MAVIRKSSVSKTWTFFDGDWHEGNVAIMGARTHAAWLGSMVFDGARLRGRRTRSRVALRPRQRLGDAFSSQAAGVGRRLARPRRRRASALRPRRRALHPPDVLGRSGGPGGVRHDPESTCWCLCVYEAPVPKPVGSAITLSPFRRPTAECAPVGAKAGCLYPNNSRALIEAKERGFDNCLMRDMLGNIAELGTANVFLARDGVVATPTVNGTFLNGITRQRVIALLRDAGVTVEETKLTYADFQNADEIFSTGNYAKIAPVIRIDDRSLQPGPFYGRARELYRAFAHG